ncbi:hypothetical protein Belba_1563 [Belliella baltica DSM 15883]|uniref:Uncharacterized protein n=1 Tax=Belliella baltica (strain DSM 15883 / CIP 108006 / LMG 21964 / BA134) TaxID=866536 RepID=I3Z4K6_BELBD|nr:hypothetical protein [Belliella baltica]AFL84174.1 hypothetical protein Belba_1563 [Belliella baltica DSM 15883]
MYLSSYKHSILLALFLVFSLSSCDVEDVFKVFKWSVDSFIGEGFLPSEEIIALGAFQRTEVNVQQKTENGESAGTIELKLYNGNSEALRLNEEGTARKCAELYAEGFSKIEDYQKIMIYFIQTDPNNPDNIAITEYAFEVKDFL